jgi:hypothetical protein
MYPPLHPQQSTSCSNSSDDYRYRHHGFYIVYLDKKS